MLRRQALPISALLLASPLVALAAPQAGQSVTPPATAGQPSDDMKKMRSFLQQMETNLVYLPAGYSSMKHQFELEIDMWRLVLNWMERAGQGTAP